MRWQGSAMVIATASRTEDRGFRSRQGVTFWVLVVDCKLLFMVIM
jgi:hypothetical protein